jgi:ElaB/YqjD/DUF883 family membrane-anchored ribosome-binding protein
MPNSNTGSTRTSSVSDDLHATGEHMREAVLERAHHLRERAGAALESGRERVRENPIRSLAIAAGVGVLIGILLSRRHSA